jgi:hypothetical protein
VANDVDALKAHCMTLWRAAEDDCQRHVRASDAAWQARISTLQEALDAYGTALARQGRQERPHE